MHSSAGASQPRVSANAAAVWADSDFFGAVVV